MSRHGRGAFRVGSFELAGRLGATSKLYMNTTHTSEWLDKYKRAWETQDSDLFVTLFSDTCHYRISPFTLPIPRRAFREFWQSLAARQKDNRIAFEILGAASGNRAIVKWHAYTRIPATGEQREGSGIFLLTFDDNARCSDLCEWQHWRPAGAPFERPVGVGE